MTYEKLIMCLGSKSPTSVIVTWRNGQKSIAAGLRCPSDLDRTLAECDDLRIDGVDFELIEQPFAFTLEFKPGIGLQLAETDRSLADALFRFPDSNFDVTDPRWPIPENSVLVTDEPDHVC